MTLPPTAIAAGVLRRLAGRRVLRLGLAEVEVLGVGQRPTRMMGGRVCTPLVRTGA